MPVGNYTNLTLAEQLLDALDALSGLHPGFRPAHAKGLMCSGTFTPSPEAVKLTRAPHARKPSTPVTVRYSDATGRQPFPTTTRSDPARAGWPCASTWASTSTRTSSPTPRTAFPFAPERSSSSSSVPRLPSGQANLKRWRPSSPRIPARSGSSKHPSRSQPASHEKHFRRYGLPIHERRGREPTRPLPHSA
jgi:hypothetical protein